MSADPGRVSVFDTTLRDGEQSPGCSMTPAEKLRIARALVELGVDVIEAGFPAASEGDFRSVQAIAAEVRGVSVCALARCERSDIARAWQAVAGAERPRLHLFLATSAIHREFKLRMAKDEILRRTGEAVALARELCADVEFSAEDAARTEPEFLAAVVARAIAAGARTINVPDTVGYALPAQYGELFTYLRSHVPGCREVVLSAHCHDDLGLAVANSLAAVAAGARQVECTLNGIGERAGNCALEEFVMALRVRADALGLSTGVRTRRLHAASRLLASVTGVPVPPNKAIVGENAFAHEAGIHQHGLLSRRETYEIMAPEDVGVPGSTLVLGKHSGRHAFRERVRALGLPTDEAALARAFQAFKELADRKKVIHDEDLEVLVLGAGAENAGWRLVALHATAGTGTPTASVALQHADGRTIREAAVGDGPIDAAFKAIERALGLCSGLRRLQLRNVGFGGDSQGEVYLEVEHDGVSHRGRGVSTDVVEAAVRAFLQAVNRIERARPAPPVCAAAAGALRTGACS